MNKTINYKDFQKALVENNLPEACQYLESVWDVYTTYMQIPFSIAKKIAEKIIQVEAEYIDNMNNEMYKQLAEGNLKTSYKFKISDMPRNICNFEGLDIPAAMMFKKSVCDFFHCAKICMELPLQCESRVEKS